jgi:Platelet-activating factor acetylhydrolase, isoform II
MNDWESDPDPDTVTRADSAPIPEPATLALVAAALVDMVVTRQRMQLRCLNLRLVQGVDAMKRWKPAIGILSLLPLILVPSAALAQTDTRLAGNPLAQFPGFEYVRAFNANSPVSVSVDAARFPAIVGQTCNIYVVNDKTASQWASNPSLTDARGAPQSVTFQASGNTFTIVTPGQIPSSSGTTALGRGYDVVLDCDGNGALSTADYIDGRQNTAGFYLVHDITTVGSMPVTAVNYSVTGTTAGFANQRTYYPTDIASMGKLPLIIISHGNGHNYTWYDYLQQHLASYGYIVMSHQNNTSPGIEACSLTTLQHTNGIIGQQATIAGGVLNGHIDETKIVWIGHSRGGEGVTRALTRIQTGSFTPVGWSEASLRLISSIAPTDFLGTALSNPGSANYHLMYGAADGDVSGVPGNPIAHSFILYERATGFRQNQYLHGVGHNEFNCCGFGDATGPALIGRAAAQTIAKGYYLAVVKRYLEGNIPAKEFMWRQYERFRPIGALQPCGFPDAASCATVDLEYRDGPSAANFVIDDYQTPAGTGSSSSGGVVTLSAGITDVTKGVMRDVDSSFAFVLTDPMNGMTRARTSDTTKGVVFSITAGANAYIEWEVAPGQRDWSNKAYLSFRAAQQTRHPGTTASLGDTEWTVVLRDGSGRTSHMIGIDAYGGGIEEPYQRTSAGAGAGWQNEFETIRIRLTDFLALEPTPVDLTDIVAVRFQWGFNTFPDAGRIALDDLEVTVDD